MARLSALRRLGLVPRPGEDYRVGRPADPAVARPAVVRSAEVQQVVAELPVETPAAAAAVHRAERFAS
jgi:hypothetical protein